MQDYLYQDLYDLEEKHWWHIAKRKIVLVLIKNMHKGKGTKILDVGCGAGKNVEEFSKIGNAYGIDNSSQALGFCKEKRHLKNIFRAEAEKTPFAKNSFDIVTLLDVLEHTDDEKTIKEMGRILKKDGAVIITVPAYGWMWSRWDEVLFHKRRYTAGGLKMVLEKNGFKVLKISYFYSFLVLPVFVTRFFKSKLSADYESDFKLSSALLNKILLFISDLERFLVLNLKVPFGLSIVAVAKKSKE